MTQRFKQYPLKSLITYLHGHSILERNLLYPYFYP